jgi:hypothetical protein
MSTLSAITKPECLGDGEIWVEYHPASGKAPEILRPGDQHPLPVTLPSHPFNENLPPWHPFRTRLDFEQAELFLRSNASNPYIDAQLKLIHTASASGFNHGITLKSAKGLRAILHSIPEIELLPEVRLHPALSNDCS